MPTPAPLPPQHHQAAAGLLPHALPPSMAPAAEPPLPLPNLPTMAMAPAAEAVTPMASHVQPSAVSSGGVSGGAAATRPNLGITTPVEISHIWEARTPDLGSSFTLPPNKETLSGSNGSPTSPTSRLREMDINKTNVFSSIGELWSPLKADGSGSKPPTLWPDSGGLRVERLSENSTDKLDKMCGNCLDSPLEPGLKRNDTSFQTGVVRRMTSFLFDDPASPLHSAENSRHGGTKSPHTAIAA